MNNKGFGIPHILAFAAFVAVIFFVAYSIIMSASTIFSGSSKIRNSKNVYKQYVEKSALDSDDEEFSSYEQIEKRVALAMDQYVIINDLKLKSKEILIKDIKVLQDNKLLSNLRDIQNNSISCEGYAKAEAASIFKNTYTGYIKCGNNYTTAGYEG